MTMQGVANFNLPISQGPLSGLPASWGGGIVIAVAADPPFGPPFGSQVNLLLGVSVLCTPGVGSITPPFPHPEYDPLELVHRATVTISPTFSQPAPGGLVGQLHYDRLLEVPCPGQGDWPYSETTPPNPVLISPGTVSISY